MSVALITGASRATALRLAADGHDVAGERERLASRLPVKRLGRPEEVADLIAAVVANAYLSNQSILIDGGWHPT